MTITMKTIEKKRSMQTRNNVASGGVYECFVPKDVSINQLLKYAIIMVSCHCILSWQPNTRINIDNTKHSPLHSFFFCFLLKVYQNLLL